MACFFLVFLAQHQKMTEESANTYPLSAILNTASLHHLQRVVRL